MRDFHDIDENGDRGDRPRRDESTDTGLAVVAAAFALLALYVVLQVVIWAGVEVLT